MIQRMLGHALPALLAAAMTGATGAALAQSPPAGQQPSGAQSAPTGDARDLLGRARSVNEGQMVEDLIRKLQGPGGTSAPASAPTPSTAAPAQAPSTAPPAAASRPAPRVAIPPPQVAPPSPATPVARTPDAPATAPVAAERPTPTRLSPNERRLMPRPMGEVLAARRQGVPMQAPIPDSVAMPTPTAPGPRPASAPTRPETPPSSTLAARPPSADPTTAAPQRRATAPRRTATEPPATPQPGTSAPPVAAAPPPAAEPAPQAARPLRDPPTTRRAATEQPQPQNIQQPVPLTPQQVERMDALPHINVEVLFVIDSADLTNQAFATLAILGRALSDPRLAKQVFLIAGHTDASGPYDYNVALSARRAEVVREFLIANFGIAQERLLARGFGPDRLRNPGNPYGRVNRRVQVVNWTSEADPSAGQPIPPSPRR